MDVIITDERPKIDLFITNEDQVIELQITDEAPPVKIVVDDYQGLSAYQLYLLTTTDDPPMTLEEWLASLAGGDLSGKANIDASNIDPHLKQWREKLDINSDRVLTLGAVTATAASIDLQVHSSGKNAVIVNGNERSKTTPDRWDFPAVTEEKIFSIYAKDDAQVFYLAMPDEELPEGALLVKTVAISAGGVVVSDNDYKLTADDSWRTLTLTTANPTKIMLGGFQGSSFHITSAVAGAKINGISGKTAQGGLRNRFWNGRPWILWNDTDKDVELVNDVYTPEPLFSFLTFAEAVVLKKRTWALVKEKNGALVVAKFGGGADFPEGNLGDVLVKGAENWEASPRLTDVEAVAEMLTDELAAETVNRAAADAHLQTQITTEQNKTASVADKFLHMWDATAGRWISSGLKFIAGTINQLEFPGRIKADAIVLPNNTNPVVANRLRSDGEDLFFSDSLSVERKLLKAGANKYGVLNPPTIAELTAMNIVQGDYYIRTSDGTSTGTELQRSPYNGKRLEDWKFTMAEWTAASSDQKAAVKIAYIEE